MKNILLAFFTFSIVTQSSGSATISVPDSTAIYLVPCAELCEDVQGSTVTVPATPCPPPGVVNSTGPFILRVSTQVNSDCYRIERINSNGTTVPPGPAYPWVKCPL